MAVVNGCLNELAFNHNPDANTDDGSCIIEGCTDIDALITMNKQLKMTVLVWQLLMVVWIVSVYQSYTMIRVVIAEQYYDCNEVCLNSDQGFVMK